MAEWVLVEADFASEYHLDLETVWRTKTWRWFSVRVGGLLTTDRTRLYAYFRHVDKSSENPA